MKLRKLESKDAKFMLEWMHDKNVTTYLAKDFSRMTLDNCINFIESSKETVNDIHLAVVDDNDEYMGTVSLKNIDDNLSEAEFAITMRKYAQGKGFARYAMREIIRIALEERNLKLVYWDVLKDNQHAVNFYDKIGGKKLVSDKKNFYLNKMGIPFDLYEKYKCYYTDRLI